MIDLKLLQKDFEIVSRELQRKNVSIETIKMLKEYNETSKNAKSAFEKAQAKQNEMSKLFGQYKREGKDITELKADVDANKIKIAQLHET